MISNEICCIFAARNWLTGGGADYFRQLTKFCSCLPSATTHLEFANTDTNINTNTNTNSNTNTNTNTNNKKQQQQQVWQFPSFFTCAFESEFQAGFIKLLKQV